MTMKRSDFIRLMSVGSLALPSVMKGMKVQPVMQPLFTTSVNAQDRVLVLIRLNGGNDGLNTLIPLDQYAHLAIQRPNVVLPESSLLKITDTLAFHPAMTGMEYLFDTGRVGIVQNVGYPEQNRSHFRSMDIWSTGMLDAAATTGWMGRYFDANWPGFPTAYPNADQPDPFAITMGYEVSSTCQGLMANFSHAITDPFESYNLDPAGIVNDGTYYGSHMEFLATLIDQTNAYGQQIYNSANAGNSLSNLYDPDNELAVQLRYIAQMISGGLKTKVYIVNINGFDTHDSQVTENDSTVGEHATLLKTLSDAIRAFMDDIRLLGLEDRVAGMTFSEFGRQIASNYSLGTDHGDAAPLFLFGNCLNNSVLGHNPAIPDQITEQAGLPMAIDFRDVYASMLKDWFEVDVNQIQSFFEHQVTFYPLMGNCNRGTVNENGDAVVLVYPNPCAQYATIRFDCQNEWVRVELLDLNARLIQVLIDGNLSSGMHNVPVELERLAVGEYIVRVRKESGVLSTKMIRVKAV
ncbi:MAG: DUF1501 domain-containing protein [Bacteroidetes bacterium]|nr:DUF1501 domain-containing protein [Bacteroidota bacterium]